MNSKGQDISQNKNEKAATLIREGEKLYAAGDLDAALVKFKESLKINPDSATAYNNIGVIFCEKDNLQMAADHFSSALKFDHNNRDAILNLGETWIELGLADQVKVLLSSYLRNNPDDHEVSTLLNPLKQKCSQAKMVEEKLGNGLAEKNLKKDGTVNSIKDMLQTLTELFDTLPRLTKIITEGSQADRDKLLDDLSINPKLKLYQSLLRNRGPAIINLPLRYNLAMSSCFENLQSILNWLITSREATNYTYDLTDINIVQLAWFISIITGKNIEIVQKYIKELQEDEHLMQHIKKYTEMSTFKFSADANAKYGRRLGWYAFVRIKKPKVIVETGIDKGLGTCVLASALLKNAKEGHYGHLYATEIINDAGYLFKEPFNKFGNIIYGDSISTLKSFSKQIDIFIHDSDHSEKYEREEFEAVKNILSDDALIISDAAHHSNQLESFAKRTDRKYLYFQENPKNHFYGGAGIGVAF